MWTRMNICFWKVFLKHQEHDFCSWYFYCFSETKFLILAWEVTDINQKSVECDKDPEISRKLQHLLGKFKAIDRDISPLFSFINMFPRYSNTLK